MNTSEVVLIATGLYDVVFYVYWIDDGNTKKTNAYRPDLSQEHHDGGFVSLSLQYLVPLSLFQT